jgi:hypothetical protein
MSKELQDIFAHAAEFGPGWALAIAVTTVLARQAPKLIREFFIGLATVIRALRSPSPEKLSQRAARRAN